MENCVLMCLVLGLCIYLTLAWYRKHDSAYSGIGRGKLLFSAFLGAFGLFLAIGFHTDNVVFLFGAFVMVWMLAVNARLDKHTGYFPLSVLVFGCAVQLSVLAYGLVVGGDILFAKEAFFVTVLFGAAFLVLCLAGLAPGDALLYMVGMFSFAYLYPGQFTVATFTMVLSSCVAALVSNLWRIRDREKRKEVFPFTTYLMTGYYVACGVCLFCAGR